MTLNDDKWPGVRRQFKQLGVNEDVITALFTAIEPLVTNEKLSYGEFIADINTEFTSSIIGNVKNNRNPDKVTQWSEVLISLTNKYLENGENTDR